MRFDLNVGIGEWFPFVQSEIKPDGEVKYSDPETDENGNITAGRVQLRIADADTLESIQSQTRKREVEHVFNPKTRQMERLPYFEQTPAQEKKERELIWDYAIMDWEDIEPFLNPDGTPIARTVDNKLRLMNIPVFARFVGRCLQMISGATNEAKVAAEKNLSPG